MSLAARALAVPIGAYRRFISPLMGRNCRFHPTCSAYALEAIRVHGAVRGGLLAIKRIGRCHPWSAGGVDRVPARRGM
ncbi:MAG: membrane protein insertion efficiency factor YidD [Actinomycetota bacterium]